MEWLLKLLSVRAKRSESVSTTTYNDNTPVITPCRASVNLIPMVILVKDAHTPASCYQGYVTSPTAVRIARSPVFSTTIYTPIKKDTSMYTHRKRTH